MLEQRGTFRIALLSSGMARSFSHPILVTNLWQNVMEPLNASLFAALDPSYEANHEKHYNPKLERTLSEVWRLKTALKWLGAVDWLILGDRSEPRNVELTINARSSGCQTGPPQFFKLHLVYLLMRRHEELTGSVYDFAFRLRPDHFFTSPMAHVPVGPPAVHWNRDDNFALASGAAIPVFFEVYESISAKCLWFSKNGTLVTNLLGLANDRTCDPKLNRIPYWDCFLRSNLHYHRTPSIRYKAPFILARVCHNDHSRAYREGCLVRSLHCEPLWDVGRRGGLASNITLPCAESFSSALREAEGVRRRRR